LLDNLIIRIITKAHLFQENHPSRIIVKDDFNWCPLGRGNKPPVQPGDNKKALAKENLRV